MSAGFIHDGSGPGNVGGEVDPGLADVPQDRLRLVPAFDPAELRLRAWGGRAPDGLAVPLYDPAVLAEANAAVAERDAAGAAVALVEITSGANVTLDGAESSFRVTDWVPNTRLQALDVLMAHRLFSGSAVGLTLSEVRATINDPTLLEGTLRTALNALAMRGLAVRQSVSGQALYSFVDARIVDHRQPTLLPDDTGSQDTLTPPAGAGPELPSGPGAAPDGAPLETDAPAGLAEDPEQPLGAGEVGEPEFDPEAWYSRRNFDVDAPRLPDDPEERAPIIKVAAHIITGVTLSPEEVLADPVAAGRGLKLALHHNDYHHLHPEHEDHMVRFGGVNAIANPPKIKAPLKAGKPTAVTLL